jgi:hypothetical protein
MKIGMRLYVGTDDFEGVLEGFDEVAEVIDDFVLVCETAAHFPFEVLLHLRKFLHRLLLKPFDVLRLRLHLVRELVPQLPQLERALSSFFVESFHELVDVVGHFLQDFLFSLDTRDPFVLVAILQF